MLDDLDFIARFDTDNALAVAAGQPAQLEPQQIKTPEVKGSFENIVFTGMGGSALAGLLLRGWLDDRLKLPFVITRGYDLPGFVNNKTLVIASSYSGNTEETLAAAQQARQKQATIIAITSGGKLLELAKTEKLPAIEIPTGNPPRFAVWFELNGLAQLLQITGLIQQASSELTGAAKSLETTVAKYLPQVKTANNPAKQLAQQLMGKAIWVYAGPTLAAVAYKWKIDFNEDAKNLASWNELPEFNHNEILGWMAQPVEKPFGVVELQSSLDSKHIAKRFELTNRLLSGKMPQPIELKAEGKTKIEQILRTVLLGDFASIYLGVLNQVNPTRIDIVEKLKKELGRG